MNASIAAEKAAARERLKERLKKEEEAAVCREMKDADEPDSSCSRSSWSGWDGKQYGWKDKQGWNKHNWGNIWEQR